MPLPTPNTGESEKDFVARCMSDETVKKDFPEQKQRVAVCFSQWRKKDTKSETPENEVPLDSTQIDALLAAPQKIKDSLADVGDAEIEHKQLLDAWELPPASLPEQEIVAKDCRILARHTTPKKKVERTVSAKKTGEDTAEIVIYDDIGSGIFGGFGVKDFSALLVGLIPISDLSIRINSYGGDVFEGIAIYNRMRALAETTRITVYIDGIAASIASVIAMGADEIVVYDNAMVMIHLPWTYAEGNEDDLETLIARLQVVKDQILAAYKRKANISDEEILDMMRKETWLTAQEAVDLGFADRIEGGGQRMAASADRDWIEHAPEPYGRQALATFSHQLIRARARIETLARN